MTTAGQNKMPIGTYDAYAEAERAVDTLADNGFPVEKVTIIGHDMRMVEKVLGRMDYKEATLRGMYGGAITGVLIGWIFGLFNWIDPIVAGLWLAFDGLIFGAIVGAAFGALSRWMQHGRRDFRSISVVAPTRYEVLVDSDAVDRAVQLLSQAQPTPFPTSKPSWGADAQPAH